MRILKIYCGCSFVIAKLEYPDQPDGYSEALGECEECTGNNGQYNKSSHWREPVVTEQKFGPKPMGDIVPIKTKADRRKERRGGNDSH